MPATNPYPLNPNPSLAAWLHNPTLSIWLAVDPLSDKYQGVSPYAYYGNNPVVLKDPNGDSLINFYTWKVREYEQNLSDLKRNNPPAAQLFVSANKERIAEYRKNEAIVNNFIFSMGKDKIKILNDARDQQNPPQNVNVFISINYCISRAAEHHLSYTENGERYTTTAFGDNTIELFINPFRDEMGNEVNWNDNWGRVSRHEGGHLFYEITHHKDYYRWLKKSGHLNEDGYGGHGKGRNNTEDPSGAMSREWEIW